MKENPIIINAHFQASPGRESELGSALQALIAPSREEPGVLVYELHRDPERSSCFMFYEKFANQAAFDAHMATAHIKTMQSYLAANESLIATVTVTKWQPFEDNW